jgi:hypothetical protein
LIDAVIDKKRVFFFEKAEEGVPARLDNKLMQEIHERTQFWSRKVAKDNEVDMSNIEITLG